MKDLVSVLILSYRNVSGIYDSLVSVFKQKYERIEVVISDDGSDNFEDEIPKLSKFIEENKGNNIENYVIRSNGVNVGTVKNLNNAIKESTGVYIKALSSEDVFSHEDAIQHYVDFIEKSGKEICFSKIRGVTLSGEFVYELLACDSDYQKLSTYTPNDICERLYRRNFLPGIAWMIKRSLFDKYGLFPEDTRIIEDYPFWIHLSRSGCEFGFLDEVLIDYRLSGVSSAGSYSEMFMNDMYIIYDKYIFPYDHKFGLLQPCYNMLKRSGLNFYMDKAKWDKKSTAKKIVSYIKYAPFYFFTSLQIVGINLKNKRRG